MALPRARLLAALGTWAGGSNCDVGGARFDHCAVLLCGDDRRDRAREVVRQGGGGGGERGRRWRGGQACGQVNVSECVYHSEVILVFCLFMYENVLQC